MRRAIKEKINIFLRSRVFAVIAVLLSVICTLTDMQGLAAFLFVISISFSLICSEHPSSAFLPFLLTCLLAGSGVADYYTFAKFIIAALPFFLYAIIYNVVKYKKKLSVGVSFLPLVCVTVALFLGGITERTSQEYFRLGSIIHIFLIGPIMLAVYLIIRTLCHKANLKELSECFSSAMLYTAVYCCFFLTYISFVSSNALGMPQFINHASLFLVLCIPFAFQKAESNNWYILFAFFMCGAIIMSQCRTALLFGGIITAICLVKIIIKVPKNRIVNSLILFLLSVCFFIAVQYVFANVAEYVSPKEARYYLFRRGISDFLESLIFGQGISYAGNSDIFTPQPMAMHWYHNMIAQIVGSMGIIGIIAYTYLFVTRIKILKNVKSAFSQYCFICYAAQLLGSLTEPGIFSPIPNGVVLTFFFVILEMQNEVSTDV